MYDNMPKWKLLLNRTKNLIASIEPDETASSPARGAEMEQRCYPTGEDDEATYTFKWFEKKNILTSQNIREKNLSFGLGQATDLQDTSSS